MRLTMLPPEIVPFVESGLSTLVGTCDHELTPCCMRGLGIRVLDEGRSARLYIPQATSAATLRNLKDTGLVAVTLSRPITHRTVQLKGRVLRIEATDDSERATVEALFCGFMQETTFLGLPPAVALRMQRWPALSIDFAIESVFVQTPGPRAGTILQPGDLE